MQLGSYKRPPECLQIFLFLFKGAKLWVAMMCTRDVSGMESLKAKQASPFLHTRYEHPFEINDP